MPPGDDLSCLPVRDQLVAGCRHLAAAGLTPGAAGNASIRETDASTLITASGARFDALTRESLVRLDAAGSPVDDGARPSSEADLHREVYRRRPDVGAIVHTHGRHAVALSTVATRVPALHYYCVLLGGPPVVAPYRTYGTMELAQCTADALGDTGSVVMAHHGGLTVGPDLATAIDRAETLEWLCEVALLALAAGTPAELTTAQLDAVVGRRQGTAS